MSKGKIRNEGENTNNRMANGSIMQRSNYINANNRSTSILLLMRPFKTYNEYIEWRRYNCDDCIFDYDAQNNLSNCVLEEHLAKAMTSDFIIDFNLFQFYVDLENPYVCRKKQVEEK